MYISSCSIRSWNWNRKLLQDNFLIEHWIQRTHRCPAVRCWPWVYSLGMVSRYSTIEVRDTNLAWVGPVFPSARSPMKSTCIFLEEVKVSRNFFPHLACWSLKENEFTIRGRSLVWVVYRILRVLLTALFQWTLRWHTYLLFVSYVWDPCQEQQYVCRTLPLTRLDTLWNFTFNLLTCDIKMPVFKVSFRSCVKVFPRWLTLSFQTRAVPCKVTSTCFPLFFQRP